jgi:Zn-dependent peptidase ImmA (M78 family)
VFGRAELIAKEYFRLAGGRVPVNLERLCRRLTFSIVEWDASPEFTAVLSVPHRIIVVNRNMHYERRRFSVAHEIGHYALGQAGIQFFGERGRAERAANRFAAALLMPEHDIERLWRDFGCDIGFPEDALADALIVSKQALSNRLKRLRQRNRKFRYSLIRFV